MQAFHTRGAVTYFQIGRALTFKSHRPTAMRVLGFPGNVVVTTSNASWVNWFGVL